MEVEGVDVDEEKGDDPVATNAESGKSAKQNVAENCSETVVTYDDDDDDESSKPYLGMEFDSEDAAKTFYDAYARRVGFSIHVGQFTRARPDGPIITWEFACSREVFKRKNVESCNAILRIERKHSETWIVTKFVEDHNHSVVTPNKVHHLRPRRHFAGATKNVADALDVSGDVYITMDGNHLSYEPNRIRNASPIEPSRSARNVGPVNYLRPPSRKRTLGRDAQNILNYFKKMQAENPGFYYAIQLDDDNRMTNIFWADARSRMAYNHFGDAVIFDTMYRPNQYQVPFAPFTGVNHLGQMVLFGCALLLDESEASFTWLFRTWLSAMNDRPPISMTTDQDRAIQVAVSQVLPETRHCICKWHILREGQERLAHIYLAHPSFYGELYSCINFYETIEEFESSWCSLLNKYDLQKNEWLHAVYNARRQWAPVYFRGTFFAALSSNQGVSSFFDGYVNQQTTIPLFFKQYERALESSIEKEIELDYDTICTTPVLKTPSPMEQQAANLYTKFVFAKFQEELVETFVYTANKIEGDAVVSKYRVAKYEQDDKAYIVSLNVSEMKASCSCQMFEYSGILCRHILTVFTVTNVLTLPTHYILKRWTRNAKVWIGLDEQNTDPQGIETLTLRFNKLCQEAIKYAAEGAIGPETYNTAIAALKEGGKKILAVKKNVAKISPSSSQGALNSLEDSNKKTPPSVPEMIPALWPWQEAMPHRFNLNDSGVSVSDLNQPSLAPVSIHRDSGTLDSTVVLTCFKSMTWVIENKSASKIAVINLKLQDYGKKPSGETEVQFRLTRTTLEPMLRSMAYISQQLSAPANKVAVINLKLYEDPIKYLHEFVVAPERMLSGRGSMFVHLNNMIFHVQDGTSVMKIDVKVQAPKLHYVHPMCFEAGKPLELVACGSNLLQSKFRFLISFGGKYLPYDYCVASPHCESDGEPLMLEHQFYKIFVPHTESNIFGPAFIEVENESGLSNFVPVLIGDKETCSEMNIIQERFEASFFPKRSQSMASGLQSDVCEVSALRQKALSDLVVDIAWLLKVPASESFQQVISSLQVQRFNHVLNFLIDNESTTILEKLLQNLKTLMDTVELNSAVNDISDIDMGLLLKYMDYAREILGKKLEKKEGSIRYCENIVPERICSSQGNLLVPSTNQDLVTRSNDEEVAVVGSATVDRDEIVPLLNREVIMNVNLIKELQSKSCGHIFSGRVLISRLTIFVIAMTAVCFGVCVVSLHPQKVGYFATSIRRSLFGNL